MRLKPLIVMLLAALPLSCGSLAPLPGVETPAPDLLNPAPELEQPEPELLSPTGWPADADLGVVVSSGIVPSANRPPPPDFVR